MAGTWTRKDEDKARASLYQRLVQYRDQRAHDLDYAPFRVASNKALSMMAELRPLSSKYLAEFQCLNGEQIKFHGHDFLAIIGHFCKEHPIAPHNGGFIAEADSLATELAYGSQLSMIQSQLLPIKHEILDTGIESNVSVPEGQFAMIKSEILENESRPALVIKRPAPSQYARELEEDFMANNADRQVDILSWTEGDDGGGKQMKMTDFWKRSRSITTNYKIYHVD